MQFFVVHRVSIVIMCPNIRGLNSEKKKLLLELCCKSIAIKLRISTLFASTATFIEIVKEMLLLFKTEHFKTVFGLHEDMLLKTCFTGVFFGDKNSTGPSMSRTNILDVFRGSTWNHSNIENEFEYLLIETSSKLYDFRLGQDTNRQSNM